MPKRTLEDKAEWSRHKGDILKIYMTEDKSLTEVIHTMASRGFKRTYVGVHKILTKLCSSLVESRNMNGLSSNGISAKMFEKRSGSSFLVD